MANNQISKEKAKELIKILGEVKGVVLQTDAEYVRQKKGGKGLLAVEKELKKIDCPIDYEKIRATSWYPLGLRPISLLVIKKVFNWGDKEIENMGNEAPKYSFLIKALLRFFLSFPRSYKEIPKYWEKHYIAGKLEGPGYSLKKKYYILRLKDFKIHPILCVYLKGYFVRVGQLVLKGNNFKGEETKCQFKGDPYHEFLITWK